MMSLTLNGLRRIAGFCPHGEKMVRSERPD